MTLKDYKRKRDFKKTPEPQGKIERTGSHKNLYIIQKHAASHLHYDFRLELNGVLLSWAVPKGPCLDPAVKRLAMHVEDHPLAYGSFEGIIPKGQYGGGTVMLWDKGKWVCEDKNPLQAYQKGNLTFSLKAKKLNGRFKLVRINKDDKTWLLMKIKDDYAKSLKEYDITEAEPNSVLSKQSMDEIADNYKRIWTKQGESKAPKRKSATTKPKKKALKELTIDLTPSPFPHKISPQLAVLVSQPPKGNNWLHEIKFDGYRLLAFKKNGSTKLYTRRHHNWTDKFPNIAKAINKLPMQNIILDGEVVVLNENQHSDFQLLQNSLKEDKSHDFYYYIFDLLYFDKYNLTALPLIERKNILKQIIPDIDGPVLRYSDHIIGNGDKIFKNSCVLNLEGIVAKNINSPYIQKRNANWLKIKCSKRQEFIIVGYTKGQGSRQFFGSLLLATYNTNGQLNYHGNVGTGFTESTLKSLHQLLVKHHTATMPLAKKPPGMNKITWVEPVLVAEVEFTEWTQDGALRHPSFKGLRNDKDPHVIRKEKTYATEKIVGVNKMPNITHPDKILYPEDNITKGDLVDYYEQIADWILPYIKNRALTLVRCPQDYKHCFYQKHIHETMPAGLYEKLIKQKDGKENGIYLKNIEGLISLVQLGTLEIHPWSSNIANIEYPDQIIFDLDPAEDITWKKVMQAAFVVKEYLADLKLKSFVKTTGGKGLHVVIPIKPEYNWEEVKNFAHVFVDFIVTQHPKEYIANMSKAKRVGKIFIDYLRNQRGATAVAAYSTRARRGAPISTPIAWEELTNNQKDTHFTINTIFKRLEKLKKDPWQDFFKIKQKLNLNKLK